MQGIDRAALILLGIGEDQASEVMKHLNHKNVQKLGQAMTKLTNVSRVEIKDVLTEFMRSADQQTNLGVGAEDYVKKVLISALGDDIASGLINRIFQENKDIQGLDALKWMDARTIADVIRNEHPQVISIVLTYIDPDQAAEVLSFLPRELCVDLMLRMASLENVQPTALQELNMIIEKQFSGNSKRKSTSLGGSKTVAEIMNNLEKSLENQVMGGIKEYDEELAAQINDLMFLFDDLVGIDDRSMQVLLREISSEILILALKGADDIMKEKVFKNMSKRAAETLREDLESKGPVRLSEVEKAQKEIITIARRLEEEGTIMLGGSGEQML